MTPREPDRFDAILEDWNRRFNHPASNRSLFDRVDLLDYLRAAESSALERAAQIAHQSQEDCFCKERPDDVPCAACMEASRIEGAIRGTADRAQIPPAAAPAAEAVCGKCGTVRPARGVCMVCDPPAAETRKAPHKADCPATHHDPFREGLCTCKPARGAEALQSIRNRITEYLSHGGLLSPDLMDHDAVSRLMRDARDAINALLAARAAPPEGEGK